MTCIYTLAVSLFWDIIINLFLSFYCTTRKFQSKTFDSFYVQVVHSVTLGTEYLPITQNNYKTTYFGFHAFQTLPKVFNDLHIVSGKTLIKQNILNFYFCRHKSLTIYFYLFYFRLSGTIVTKRLVLTQPLTFCLLRQFHIM